MTSGLAPATVPRSHAVGDVLIYTLHGTISQAIVGHDPFGRAVRQGAAATQLQGRERIAVRAVDGRGLSLHRSGSVIATFGGKSSPAQPGSGWTLVTPQGIVRDRKGSTLGGLFLLPLGFLADQAIHGGSPPAVGDRWDGALGMALFGMTSRPRLRYTAVGTRRVFGIDVVSLVAEGIAPVREPIVTNDGLSLGEARGIAHVTLRCDYDPATRRAVAMDVVIDGDLKIAAAAHASAAGTVQDRQRILVALDAASIRVADPAATARP